VKPNESHIHALRKILPAISIFSPTGFSFAGQTFEVQPAPPPAAGMAQEPPANPLIAQLQQVLYAYTYQQRFDGVVRPLAAMQSPGEDMTEALSQANASRERWFAGWQIIQVSSSNQVTAQKKGAVRSVWPGEFISHDGPGTPPRVGATISLFSPRESRAMQPGFYFAFGENASEPYDMASAVRFYWNVSDAGAVELVHALTATLNRFQVPFRFKCCSHRALFTRLDSAVLYANKRHWRFIAELLADLYRGLHTPLEPDTPLFTLRLAPGLAFAEEPVTGESFGGFCCRVVAEGIWNASMQGNPGVQARLEAIARQFKSYGSDFDRPHLRPGSVDNYAFPAFSR
jgi:hypothetical protein